jgi:uncharacterized membrane protein YfcA
VPDLSAFASTSFLLIVAPAFLAGLVRGFSGFGYALMFVPLAAMAMGPAAALALLWLVDAPFALALAAPGLKRTDWRAIAPLLATATLATPVGTALLVRLDPVAVRWFIGLAVLGGMALIVSGWRRRGAHGLALNLAVGAVSGVFRGLAGLGGLPIALFWLGGDTRHEAFRINSQSFLLVTTVVSGVVFWANGLFAAIEAGAVVATLAAYGLGVVAGGATFRVVDERGFRGIVFVLIALAAAVSLPALDPVFGR